MLIPSLSESVPTKPVKSPHLLTAMLVGTILSFGSPYQAHSESPKQFLSRKMLDEIFPVIPLEQVREEIMTDIHNKIMTDTDFHVLSNIREYLLSELRRKGVNPTSVSVQIVPFYPNPEGGHDYLSLSISQGEDKINIPLTTLDTDSTTAIMSTMVSTFEQHIQQAALVVFQQELQNSGNVLKKSQIESEINAVLRPEFESCMQNCIEYLGTKITRGSDGNAEIQIFIFDKPTKTQGYVPVQTDVPIPEKKTNNGPMMMAQNTSGTQQ